MDGWTSDALGMYEGSWHAAFNNVNNVNNKGQPNQGSGERQWVKNKHISSGEGGEKQEAGFNPVARSRNLAKTGAKKQTIFFWSQLRLLRQRGWG